MPVEMDSLLARIAAGCGRHNEINLLLISSIPNEGFQAVPVNSRGRTVSAQLAHMNSVRLGWLQYHATGKRPQARGQGPPSRSELSQAFKESGEAVCRYLTEALAGTSKIRMFGGDPMRWLLYLVSHEAHHRGQIALALKQSGMRLPEKVALRGLWGTWIFGR